ncbi:MAG: tRNA lysidine(34) synthetase TilS [Clostridia bacterium]|nr:tRNA lysidine(34) synthetase TilS [Clostridia bacterium]
MLRTIERTMLSHGMLPMRSVLVGLSGGADSAALAHILYALSDKYGFAVYAAHVNHGLRGVAADADEEFSRGFAESLGIPFFSLRADVRAEAARRGVSEELAGRSVRYDFFDRLAQEHGIERVATAHHKNDNAETILMNLMRGSGISGLCGIPYTRGRIIRPMLDVSRAEIEGYCAGNGIRYVTDATNLETVYTRNRVRNVLIPLMEKEFNPSVVDTITSNARLIARDEDFLNSAAEAAYTDTVKDGAADAAKLAELHTALALRVARRMIGEVTEIADVPQTAAESVLALAKGGRTGARVDIVRGAYAVMEYGMIRIKEGVPEKTEFEYKLRLGEKLYIPELGVTVLAEECDGMSRDGAEYFGAAPDADIRVRSRRVGDRFRPWGMDGTKRLKSFLIDEKVPRDMRDRIGIVTINGEIAWVMGHRRDERFRFEKKGIKIFTFLGGLPSP